MVDKTKIEELIKKAAKRQKELKYLMINLIKSIESIEKAKKPLNRKMLTEEQHPLRRAEKKLRNLEKIGQEALLLIKTSCEIEPLSEKEANSATKQLRKGRIQPAIEYLKKEEEINKKIREVFKDSGRKFSELIKKTKSHQGKELSGDTALDHTTEKILQDLLNFLKRTQRSFKI